MEIIRWDRSSWMTFLSKAPTLLIYFKYTHVHLNCIEELSFSSVQRQLKTLKLGSVFNRVNIFITVQLFKHNNG